MAIFGSISRFLDKYIVGYALGTAAGPALAPFAQSLANEAWQANQVRPLDVWFLGQGVAQGQIEPGWATEWAANQGISADAFGRLVAAMEKGPGVAEGFSLWRRGLIGDGGFRRALKRAALEGEWADALVAAKHILLSPAELANGIQQGHLPNPGVLPTFDPTADPAPGASSPLTPDGQPPTSVPLTTIDIDPVAMAEGHGVPLDQLQVLANLAGLPPGPMELLSMWNRGLISEDAVNAGIREGHMKTKWTGAFKRLRWAVLSPQEAASARLRTWISAEESYRIGALTGHTKEQMDLMFLNRGRPASPTQMWTAWARKIVGPRGVPVEYEDHAKAIAISDIRPEYAEMLWGIRFAYPSLFQLGRLVSSAAINPDTAALWASYNRYGPDVTDKMLVYWRSVYPGPGGSSGKLKQLTEAELRSEYEGGFIAAAELQAGLEHLGYTADEATMLQHLGDAGRVKAYRDKVLEALHKAYVQHAIDDTVAATTMNAEGVSAEAQASLLRLWQLERDFARQTLTAAQIRAAYRKNLITQATALAELVDRGYSAADAAIYLGS